MRLINRHADNHSGFMVTTDYQVVQGGIFHIRDVTLFQWRNTCSTCYKRIHTQNEPSVCACVCVCTYIYSKRPCKHSSVNVCSRIKKTGFGEMSKCFVLLAPSLLNLSPPSPPPSLSLSLSRHYHLKIIPTFEDDYKNARLLFQENDLLTDHHRHSTLTRYPFSRLVRRLLTRAGDVIGCRPSGLEFQNHSTERMKLQSCR